jgi:putative effector of murein hydrolase LrgA (UPF0299 family)
MLKLRGILETCCLCGVKLLLLFMPFQVAVISAEQMDFQNFQNTADVLSNSGSLFEKIARRRESIHSSFERPVGFIASRWFIE